MFSTASDAPESRDNDLIRYQYLDTYFVSPTLHSKIHTNLVLSGPLSQVHGPSSQHVIHSTITASHPSTTALNRAWIANNYQDEYSENVHTKKEIIVGGKCLSIGIQVIIHTLLGFVI